MTQKDDYLKRQVHILSNLGLFYIIIIALFAVPLFATFVVVIIKGVLDFKYAIIVGGALILIIALVYLVKFLLRMFEKVRQDGFAAKQDAGRKMKQGEPVEISVFNGLITFSYGSRRHANALPYHQENPALLLPHETENRNSQSDIITRLKELSNLKSEGIISEDEFQEIKTKLMKEVRSEVSEK